MKYSGGFKLLLTVSFVFLFFGGALGKDLYVQNFTGADGGQPAGWTVSATGLTLQIQNNEYRLSSGSAWALAYFNGTDLTGASASTWADYTLRVSFRLTGSANCGVIFRGQSAGSYYTARLNNGASAFELYRIGGPGTQLLATQSSISYGSAETWSIEVTADGTSLVARLFDADNALVAEISAVDSAFSSGFAGLRGNPMNNVIVWDDFSVTQKSPSLSLIVLTSGN